MDRQPLLHSVGTLTDKTTQPEQNCHGVKKKILGDRQKVRASIHLHGLTVG